MCDSIVHTDHYVNNIKDMAATPPSGPQARPMRNCSTKLSKPRAVIETSKVAAKSASSGNIPAILTTRLVRLRSAQDHHTSSRRTPDDEYIGGTEAIPAHKRVVHFKLPYALDHGNSKDGFRSANRKSTSDFDGHGDTYFSLPPQENHAVTGKQGANYTFFVA